MEGTNYTNISTSDGSCLVIHCALISEVLEDTDQSHVCRGPSTFIVMAKIIRVVQRSRLKETTISVGFKWETNSGHPSNPNLVLT